MAKPITLIFLFITIISSSALSQLTFWNELFLYYPLNGNTLDYSGFNNHGNPTSISYTTGVFSDQEGAAQFDGTNSFISRQFFNLSDSCTLSGWFYSESDSQSTALIYNGHTGLNGFGVFIKKPFGTMQTGYYGKKVVLVQGGVSENTFNGAYNFPMNQWIHLALVRRNQFFELYLNGEYQTAGIIDANTPTNNFCLGSTPEHIQNGFPSFLGKIDEVMLFKSALSQQDVQKVYLSNLTSNSIQLTNSNVVKIFPNPSNKGKIFVMSQNAIQCIKIYNSTGKNVEIIYPNNTANTEINTHSLSYGIYSLVIESEKRTNVRTITIQ